MKCVAMKQNIFNSRPERAARTNKIDCPFPKGHITTTKTRKIKGKSEKEKMCVSEREREKGENNSRKNRIRLLILVTEIVSFSILQGRPDIWPFHPFIKKR